MVVPVPLQTVVDTALIATVGVGLTVAVILNEAPTQLPVVPEVGVTVYVAVTGAEVGLESVPFIELPLPAAPPVKPLPVGALHEYVVFAGTIVADVGIPFEGVIVNVPPSQIVTD